MLPPNISYVNMDKTQKKIYEALEQEKSQLSATIKGYNEAIDKIKKSGDPNGAKKIADKEQKIKICNDMMKGLQASYQATANDPRIFLLAGDDIKEKLGCFVKDNYKFSPKTERLLDLVENITDSGQKVIIFSMYERCVRLLKQDIEEILKIKVVDYTGSVSSEQREANVKAFMTDDGVKVFIATSAAQEGL